MWRKRLTSTASLVAPVLVLATLPSQACADDWARIASTRAGWIFEINASSFARVRKDGVSVFAAVIRVHDPEAGQRTVERVAFPERACDDGYGALMTTDLAGQPKHHNDVTVPGRVSIASTIAETLCVLGGALPAPVPGAART